MRCPLHAEVALWFLQRPKAFLWAIECECLACIQPSMRLLNAGTLVLKEYFEDNVSPYAILSHRWRDGEVSFQDIQSATPTHRAGYEEIRRTCLRALGDGLTHAWIDTCCTSPKASSSAMHPRRTLGLPAIG